MEQFIKIVGLIFGGIGLALLLSLIIALPVMWLWNYLMPNLFALPVISLWQAFAMALLTSVLFKSSSSSK